MPPAQRFIARSALPKVTAYINFLYRHLADFYIEIRMCLKPVASFKCIKGANRTGDPARILIFSRHPVHIHVNPAKLAFGVWHFLTYKLVGATKIGIPDGQSMLFVGRGIEN